jgi:hypothetical protein
MCIKSFGGGTCRKDHLEDLGEDERILLKWLSKKWNEGAWTGLIWLKIGTGGDLLGMR